MLLCCRMGTCSCCSGNRKVKRGLWSPEEDHTLKDFVNKHGHKIWSQVPIKAGLERCGKSCRLRCLNYLRPGIKRGKLSAQEQELIFDLQTVYGNRWSWIAKWLPGRTDTEIKNFWKVHQKGPSKRPLNMCAISSYRLAVPLRLHIYDPKPELDVEDEGNKCEANVETQTENEPAHVINQRMDDFDSDICSFYDELPDLMLWYDLHSGDIC